MDGAVWTQISFVFLAAALVSIVIALQRRSDGGRFGLWWWLPISLYVMTRCVQTVLEQSQANASLDNAEPLRAQEVWVTSVVEWVMPSLLTASAVIIAAGVGLVACGFRLPKDQGLSKKVPIEGKVAAAVLPLACIVAALVEHEALDKTRLIFVFGASLLGALSITRLARAPSGSRRLVAAMSCLILITGASFVLGSVGIVREMLLYMAEAPPDVRVEMIESIGSIRQTLLVSYAAMAVALAVILAMFIRLDRSRGGRFLKEFAPAGVGIGIVAVLVGLTTMTAVPLSGIADAVAAECRVHTSMCLERPQPGVCTQAMYCDGNGVVMDGDPQQMVPILQFLCANPSSVSPHANESACRRLEGYTSGR